jgi:hypothetical protein
MLKDIMVPVVNPSISRLLFLPPLFLNYLVDCHDTLNTRSSQGQAATEDGGYETPSLVNTTPNE